MNILTQCQSYREYEMRKVTPVQIAKMRRRNLVKVQTDQPGK